MTKPITSFGYEMDTSPGAFGELRPSNDIFDDTEALRERIQTDGYVFLRDCLNVDDVMTARREILTRIEAAGGLAAGHPLMDGISPPDVNRDPFDHKLAQHNDPLSELLYSGPLLSYFDRFLGRPAGHFDYTWFRAVPGGAKGVFPHCDTVYMSRGSKNLFTAWVPIGDVPMTLGGLIILEGSHLRPETLGDYYEKDVDTYCLDSTEAAQVDSGNLEGLWDGRLSENPVELRRELGCRWLTADFRAGDLLTFTMRTVHASLDNHSSRWRLSSDSRYQPADEPHDGRWMGEYPPAHGAASKIGMVC